MDHRDRSMVIPFGVASGGAGIASRPGFDPLTSMSAMARFPFVWASVKAIETDMVGVPIKVREGPNQEDPLVPDHPILELLANPSSSCTEDRLRKQIYTDYTLTGNAYLWLNERTLPDSDGPIVALRRLHPHHTEAHTNRFGDVLSWVYGDLKGIDPRTVFHIADSSWTDEAAMIYGETPIRPLKEDLETQLFAKKHAARSSKFGRPELHFSAPENSPLMAEKAMNKVIQRYEGRLSQGKRAFFTSGGIGVEQLSWNMKDLEFTTTIERGDISTTVAFGVPATRLGIPSANYGNAMVQDRLYFQGLQARAKVIDDQLSLLAFRLAPDLGRVRVFHDFSGVEALQNTRDQRQQRGIIWNRDYGVEIRAAAAYEGFNDLPPTTEPIDGTRPRRPAQDPVEPTEPQED